MSKQSIPLSCWAAEDRPSERMEAIGLQGLTNAELLSIIIGSGSVDANAVDTARLLLSKCNNSLKELYKCNREELAKIRGIGEMKSAKVKAALELGLRISSEHHLEAPTFLTATQVYNYMHPNISYIDIEEFWVLFCNQRNKLIKASRISMGGLSETLVDIRVVMYEAIKHKATAMFAVHNHPSGSLKPSRYDDELTKDLQNACKVMRIYFCDHVIITDGAYYSYHEQGKL